MEKDKIERVLYGSKMLLSRLLPSMGTLKNLYSAHSKYPIIITTSPCTDFVLAPSTLGPSAFI